MKYNAPFDATDPDAPYIDEDNADSVLGSVPPAAAIEHPQRELVALEVYSGLTPSGSRLTQVAEAVRSQRMNFPTVGGTANALTVTLSPAPASWADLVGVPLRMIIATPNTGAATLSPNGLTPKAIVSVGGNALKAGQLPGGAIVTAIYDGTNVQVSAPLSPRFATSVTVISAPGAGNYTVPAGVYRIRVHLWGPGGGAGGGSGASNGYEGTGGGGGGHTKKEIDVTPGQVIPYVNGTRGIGGGPGGAGTAGTTTSFGAFCSATSGSPGEHGKFGISGNIAPGGVGIGGDLNLQGGAGTGALPAASDGTGIGSPGGGTPFGAPGGTPSGGPTVDGLWPGGGGNGAGGTGGATGGNGAHGGIIIETL